MARKLEITNMLKSELKTMIDPVKATFKREGPLRIGHFRRVADAYGLPMPYFGDEKTQLKCIKDGTKHVYVGQFKNVTESFPSGAHLNGIVRKFNHEGNFLSEYMEIDGKKVGLIRFINSAGCVSYIVHDLKGERIEAKFFDPLGNLVKSCSREEVPIVPRGIICSRQ